MSERFPPGISSNTVSMIEIAIFPRGQVTAEPLGDDALAAELTRLPENDRAIALVMLV
jgi:hypothetical protein